MNDMRRKMAVRWPDLRAWLLAGAALASLGGGIRSPVQDPKPAPVSTPAPPTLALLVGIKQYAHSGQGDGVEALDGPENDVARARKLLVDRFGFDPNCIKTLIGPAATHAAIVRTFHEHLIRRAGPDTRVVFWFSGHGSRIPDATQSDGSPRDISDPVFDETLVAYDSRAVDPAGSYDLIDDELYSLLLALRARDVVVVTDCCHSGGVLRSGRSRGVRECDAGTAPLARGRLDSFWPKDVPLLDDEQGNNLTSVVQLAACGAEQEAGELDTPAGKFGTFTWFLSHALGKVDPRASWGEVAAIVRAGVAGQGNKPSQLVQVVGDAGRSVFGGRARMVPPGYQVDRYGTNGLLVAAGRLHGLGENAELRLVDMDGKTVGTASVRRVSASTSNAEWTGVGEPPTFAMRALAKTPGDGHPPLKVVLAAGVDEKLLEGSDVAVAVKDGVAADYVLRAQGAELELCDAKGACVRRLRNDRAELQLHLLREHRYRSLWEGIAEPGRFHVDLAVEAASAEEAAARNIPVALVRSVKEHGAGFAGAVVGAIELDPNHRPSGGLVKLTVTNSNDEDLNIAIVSVGENREVNVIYGKDVNNVVRARDRVTRFVWLGPGKGWPKGQAMVDRYVVVATPRFADFMPFESDAPVGPTRGDAGQNLPPFLRAALGGARTRGLEMEMPAWGIGFCDLQIVTPEVFEATKGK